MVGTVVAISVAASLAAQQPIGEGPDTAPATQATRTTRYDAAFFAPFAPRSALDIARRVPGFALEQGNNDIRGFAGAAGNVVFNGARPSSKSESLETILARIPARRVIRVELGSGDLYGSEYSGKSQVLNVILSADSGLDGSVTASARRRYTGLVVPNLSGSALLKRGDSSFGLSAGTQREDTLDEGTDTLTVPGDRRTGRIPPQAEPLSPAQPVHRGQLFARKRARQGDPPQCPLRALHRGFRPDQSGLSRRRARSRRPPLPDRRPRPAFELGGDISRPLAGGVAKFVALGTRRHRETLDTSLERVDGITVGGFEQGTESQRNESIGRLNWTRANLAGFTFETGAEISLNSLDYALDLFILGPDGARDRLDLPIDNATVREVRGEVYVKAGRALSKNLRVDAGPQCRGLAPQGARRHERRSLAQVPQAQRDPRLEARRRLAHASSPCGGPSRSSISSTSSVRPN